MTDDGDTFQEYDESEFEPTEEDNMDWSDMKDGEYDEYETDPLKMNLKRST